MKGTENMSKASTRTQKIALISTGVGVVEPISSIIKKGSRVVDLMNIVDDSIVSSISRNNCEIPNWIRKRIVEYMCFAENSEANAILLTCSSISELVDVGQQFVDIPVFKIDEAMAEKAVSENSRIGVVATLSTTLEPTKRLLQSKAHKYETEIHISESLCEGAFEALGRGNAEEHDRVIVDETMRLCQTCDVVVLAQASMARVEEKLGGCRGRVLTSPALGVKRVLDYLNSGGLEESIEAR